MKKYLIILFVAFFAIACQDEAQWADGQGENQQPTKTEQVRETEQKEKNNQDNDKEGSSSLLKFFVFISLLMSLSAFIMALTQMLRRKTPSEIEINNLKSEIAKLNTTTRNLESSIRLLKSKENVSSNSRERSSQYIIGGEMNQRNETVSQKPQEDKKDAQEEANKEKQKSPEQTSNTKKESNHKGTSSKRIYLGLNSQNFFTDVSEEKTETSKFVATVITGGMAANFEIIDVERIRSVNTSYSVKQKGNVAIKDANGIKHQEPGKMHKSTQGDKTFWVIDTPVVVEFTK